MAGWLAGKAKPDGKAPGAGGQIQNACKCTAAANTTATAAAIRHSWQRRRQCANGGKRKCKGRRAAVVMVRCVGVMGYVRVSGRVGRVVGSGAAKGKARKHGKQGAKSASSGKALSGWRLAGWLAYGKQAKQSKPGWRWLLAKPGRRDSNGVRQAAAGGGRDSGGVDGVASANTAAHGGGRRRTAHGAAQMRRQIAQSQIRGKSNPTARHGGAALPKRHAKRRQTASSQQQNKRQMPRWPTRLQINANALPGLVQIVGVDGSTAVCTATARQRTAQRCDRIGAG